MIDRTLQIVLFGPAIDEIWSRHCGPKLVPQILSLQPT